MRFEFDKKNWTSIEEGEKDCYLLTNGLGGYSSLSVIGAAARGDQALLMSAKRAPNVRMHLVSNIFEQLVVDGQEHILTSQRMKSGKDYVGFHYLEKFIYDDFDEVAPVWIYRIEDVTVTKHLQMMHSENKVVLWYEIDNPSRKNVTLELLPLLRFTSKKEDFDAAQNLDVYQVMPCDVSVNADAQDRQYCITDGEIKLFLKTNANLSPQSAHLFGELYFSQDERDGRVAYGNVFVNCILKQQIETKSDTYVIFSTETITDLSAKKCYEASVQKNSVRKKQLLSQAPLSSELGKQLVLSADAYVVRRDSTNGKSIIAGYPFFEDWGRDTMISLAGATIVTGRFAECKSILQTFANYVKNGLLPNLFPEGGENP